MPDRTPLDRWIARKIGVQEHPLTRQKLAEYQLGKLRETVAWACERSPFYAQRLKGFADARLSSFRDFHRLPFTSADDLREHGLQFLCISQGDIYRVVTLESSGTSGTPKRVFFSAEEQELTINFFQTGMSAMVKAGETVMIALPCKRPGSVGDLLAEALHGMEARAVREGPITDPVATVETMRREKIDCVVGLPVQILSLIRCGISFSEKRDCFPKRVLLCSDHVPDSIVRAIQQAWGSEVFEHYGMTEMGLGGGVDCEAHSGYHLREADLYFEIVDVESGVPVPPGQLGEIVFTTLTRRGMPFIRYRTGDISRFIPGKCACGSVLQRMERVHGRRGAEVAIGAGSGVTMAALDEVLFDAPEVHDFTAGVIHGHPTTLRVSVLASSQDDLLSRKLQEAIELLPALRAAKMSGELDVMVQVAPGPYPACTGKRQIREIRHEA